MLQNDVVLYRRTITFSHIVSTNHNEPDAHPCRLFQLLQERRILLPSRREVLLRKRERLLHVPGLYVGVQVDS